ncbi:MAG: hypothetical protein JWR61_4219 [Ferruginibacter sp.]|uniref:hypothetical protein n=1 Tax=Ferruginibacter sp. TaxID=1940288 RepID=UPI00265B47F0|nr:hypothetical protein [Ferruginibacter sp.]MDB5279264.1 hypothetical protein [Ferruginibacter sp.]
MIVRTDEGDFPKWLFFIKSPSGKFEIDVRESGDDKMYSVTTVMINGNNWGATAYDAFGINLYIKAHWKDDKTVVIETKKNMRVLTRHLQVQLLRDIIRIEYVEV